MSLKIDAPNNAEREKLKKECDGLAGIIGHFQGEAGKALDRFNSQLAYSQRLRSSFSRDNREWGYNSVDFLGDLGGDISFGMAGGLIGGQFAGIGKNFFDSYKSAGEGDGLSSAGHITVGVYVFANEIRPSIYRSQGYATMAGRVLPVAAGLGVGIKAYEHFGATVYNEWQQAGFMRQVNQTTSQLMDSYVQQDALAKQFQQQWKDKGCDKL